PLDGPRTAGPGSAHASVLLLGIPRTRLPAGRQDGELEGRAFEARRAAGALRPRLRWSRDPKRCRVESRRGREDRNLSENGEDRVSTLAAKVNKRTELLRKLRAPQTGSLYMEGQCWDSFAKGGCSLLSRRSC